MGTFARALPLSWTLAGQTTPSHLSLQPTAMYINPRFLFSRLQLTSPFSRSLYLSSIFTPSFTMHAKSALPGKFYLLLFASTHILTLILPRVLGSPWGTSTSAHLGPRPTRNSPITHRLLARLLARLRLPSSRLPLASQRTPSRASKLPFAMALKALKAVHFQTTFVVSFFLVLGAIPNLPVRRPCFQG